ncbi:tetratricopeptide repeat protein [Hoeflea sp.]|uniref:tetratricopeptide repeat protein n=1 Tax=Hoeflea sp. TaxID=1940281 RepID=UPI003B025A4E
MLEYDWAVDADKPRLMHRAPGSFPVPRDVLKAESPENQRLQEEFRSEIDHHTGQSNSWDTPEKLADAVKEAVHLKILEIVTAEQKEFTVEKHELSLLDRMRDITLQIPHLTDAERAAKLEERNEIEEQLRNLERSFAKQVEHIRELEAMLRNDRDLLGDAKIDFALQRMQQGDFDEANKLFTELIDSASDVIERLARAEYARGEIADAQLRWDDSRWHYQRSAQLAPNFRRGNKMALHFWLAGERDEALRTFQQLRDFCRIEYGQTHPDTATATHNFAEFLGHADRVDEAEQNFMQAIEILTQLGSSHDAQRASFHSNYGRFLRRQSRTSDAVIAFRAAADAAEASDDISLGEHTGILANLGTALQECGDIDEAKSVFIRVRKRMGDLSPDSTNWQQSAKQLLAFFDEHDKENAELPVIRDALDEFEKKSTQPTAEQNETKSPPDTQV